ncbi:hypothetical protein GYMLUDRAFT_893891 [Collybiopsis luxurians FD-317 M1]|uniref:Uncharacterized protein n=1 Tax=Collybiopsis luxurians FD-317 M1 TaxID=944289 RepID=A0A0D0BY44_9AGAR|nr:hypothetical protein GYMLUDRAFT_893891 [Collybiopsis luxurians FD-317 M1]
MGDFQVPYAALWLIVVRTQTLELGRTRQVFHGNTYTGTDRKSKYQAQTPSFRQNRSDTCSTNKELKKKRKISISKHTYVVVRSIRISEDSSTVDKERHLVEHSIVGH